jgi:imidazole glycerol-phosphate synthase subunit HisH
MVRLCIADYGVGNLHSIRKALENCGAEAYVEKDINALLEAECIVFPGVGAFSKTMEHLQPFRSELLKELENGKPCLGICIGSQILFESSEEGDGPGLGLLKGRVVRLKAERVPHMGWNSVDCQDKLFESVGSPYFYFAHSFYGNAQEDVVVGTTDYYGRFPTVFRKGNTYGVQFHPEKSSSSGLMFLRNFVRFAEGCK